MNVTGLVKSRIKKALMDLVTVTDYCSGMRSGRFGLFGFSGGECAALSQELSREKKNPGRLWPLRQFHPPQQIAKTRVRTERLVRRVPQQSLIQIPLVDGLV